MCWLSLFIGYTTQEIKVNENQFSYNIQMSEDTQTLDEVVVVGFGTQRKANLTEAVATVDTKILDSRPVTNLGQSLQGTIPGLNLSCWRLRRTIRTNYGCEHPWYRYNFYRF